VLDLVDQYLALGFDADAMDLLRHSYADVPDEQREPGSPRPDRHPLVAYYRGYVRERLGGSGGADFAAAAALPLSHVFPSRPTTYAVLRAALASNASDHGARFLLGSLFFSAGLADEAVAEWQRVRTARPATPTLHRNLGMALRLRAGGDREAREVLEEGLRYDPANVELYEALDGVLSALDAAPDARAAVFDRFPPTAAMPPSLVFRRALAAADAGRHDAAHALLRDRYLAREEGGTSARAVLLQLRLRRAAALAGSGQCRAAGEAIARLGTEAPDLPFTRGGLADLVESQAAAWQIAAIESSCPSGPPARARLERLAAIGAADTAALRLALADEARRRLGRQGDDSWRRRLEEALARTTAAAEAAGGGNPGSTRWVQGLLLRALGREAEAQEAWRAVFRLPDRQLSHHLARLARRGGPVETIR
jgi:tetratricopeptide (TPR) repeat protein